MTEELIIRLQYVGLTVLFVLLCMGIKALRQISRGRYAPFFSAVYLPLILAGFPLLLLLVPEKTTILTMTAVHVLISAVIYLLLMLILTPLLRRKFSAEGCAMLWILPNLLLYWCMTMGELAFRMDHRLILRIPRRLFWGLLLLWSVGFLTVMLWQTFSHLRFRRTLRKNATEAGPMDTWLLNEVLNELHAQNYYVNLKLPVFRSPSTEVPLSVGLLQETTFLVLPEKKYTEDELRMIFRHEVIHLMHQDNRLKLTLTLICAAGWFLPGLRIGMERAAEELELCCDELVTENMDAAGRRRYADLLLQNAGTARGYTTCLSASASGLRYRLKRIMFPEKRRFGVLIAAVFSALFAFIFGIFGFALEAGTFRSEILERDGNSWHISRISAWGTSVAEEASTAPEICAAVENLFGEQQLDETPDRKFNHTEQLGIIWLNSGDQEAVITVFPTGFLYYPDAEKPRCVIYSFRTPPDLSSIFAGAD